MAYFSIAHILQLRDGVYAVRSADYPACEGRDAQAWPAREKFRTALSEQVREMIGAGEMPPGLYASLDEAQAKFGEHCRTQLEAEDRQPDTSDYAVIVDLDLPAARPSVTPRSGSASSFPRAGYSLQRPLADHQPRDRVEC